MLMHYVQQDKREDPVGSLTITQLVYSRGPETGGRVRRTARAEINIRPMNRFQSRQSI